MHDHVVILLNVSNDFLNSVADFFNRSDRLESQPIKMAVSPVFTLKPSVVGSPMRANAS
jgi:hypothetical protein